MIFLKLFHDFFFVCLPYLPQARPAPTWALLSTANASQPMAISRAPMQVSVTLGAAFLSLKRSLACLAIFFFASYLTIIAHKLTSPKSRYNCAAELFCCLFVAINFPIHFLARNAAHCTKITCCYALKPIKYSRKSTWRNKMRSETCSRGIKYNGARYKSSSTRLN